MHYLSWQPYTLGCMERWKAVDRYCGGTVYPPTHCGTTSFILYGPRHERYALLDLCQGLLTQVLITWTALLMQDHKCKILSKYCTLCWISRFITTQGMQYYHSEGSNKPDIQHSSVQYLFCYIYFLWLQTKTASARALKTETVHSSKTTLAINRNLSNSLNLACAWMRSRMGSLLASEGLASHCDIGLAAYLWVNVQPAQETS